MPLGDDNDFLPQLEQYRRAGVNVVSLNIGFADMSPERHFAVAQRMRHWIMERSDAYALVSTTQDIRQCLRDGRLGIFFDIEGMGPVLDRPDRVRELYAIGVRWMLVAYNRSNAAGGGCMDEDSGLSGLGRLIIDKMQQAGMVLCLSHTGARTAEEAIEYSANPVIFSHSNPAGDHVHPRNVSDRLLKACARKGGVIGLSGIGPFLGHGRDPRADFFRQLFYLVDLIGHQHVGIGLDFVFDRRSFERNIRRNPGLYPAGVKAELEMIGPEIFRDLPEELLRAGLADEAIAGIMGENWMRVAQGVWR
jgi:membrane dipeptidase